MKRILLAIVAAYLITGCAAKAPIQTPDSRVYSDTSSSFPVITRESDKRRATNTHTIDILTKVMSGEVPEQGNATGAGNARVRTDSNGYLMAAGQTYVGPDGPLTNFGNIRVRTDTNGYLMVALAGGSVTAPFQVNSDGIATTSTDGYVCSNATAATAGVPVQQSCRLRFRSNVWNTTAVAATNTDDFFLESVPISGTTPSGLLKFGSSLNGAAATYPLTVSSAGVVTSASSFITGGTTNFLWSGRSSMSSPSDGVILLTNAAVTDFGRLQFGGTTSSFPAWKRNAAGLDCRLADDSGYCFVSVSGLYSNSAQISTGSNSAGITTASLAQVQNAVYKATVPFTSFIAAAVTADVTVGTLPIKTQVTSVFADLTATFVCGSVCTTATLSMTCGSSAGANDILLTFDADAATTQRGLADADLGSALARATAVQGGKIFSWAATTPFSCRLTSGTGNIGTGAATNLSAGSVTFYITTTRMP